MAIDESRSTRPEDCRNNIRQATQPSAISSNHFSTLVLLIVWQQEAYPMLCPPGNKEWRRVPAWRLKRTCTFPGEHVILPTDLNERLN